MNSIPSKPIKSPHLTKRQVKQRLHELEHATDQRRIDLITELAWRPAWAIRSRRGAMSSLLATLFKNSSPEKEI